MDNENNPQEGGSQESQHHDDHSQQMEGVQQEGIQQQEGTPAIEQQQASAEYTLDLGEHWGGTDGLRGNIITRAQEAGLTSEQGSRFVASVIADMHAEESARIEASNKQLRADWGEHYESNVSETQKFITRMAESAGLQSDQVSALHSSDGLVLMNAIRQQFSEGKTQGGGNASAALSAKDQMRAMLHDPSNPYYEGLTNLNAPIEKRREAVSRYNSLSGYNVYPMP